MSKFITIRFEVSDDTDKEAFIDAITHTVHGTEDIEKFTDLFSAVEDVQDNDNIIE